MTDSPGWAAPGSPSDGQGSDADRPAAQPTGTGNDTGTGTTSGEGTTPAQAPGPTADAKWSAAQPPPGQWTSPATGPTPQPAAPPAPQAPAAGWGTRPGSPYQYPGGWGSTPPAAKPGIIPLRPLGLGEILDGAVGTLRGHWRSVLTISLVVAALSQVALLAIQRTWLNDLPTADENLTPSQAVKLMGDTAVVYATQYFLELLGLILVTALLAPVVSRAVLGQASTPSDTLKAVRPLAPRMLALTGLLLLGAVAALLLPALPGILTGSAALTALGIPVGFVLLAWFYVTFVLAPPALMLERGSAAAALKRSAKLVRGSWWRIFGISLLIWLIRTITAMVIVMPFAGIALLVSPEGLSGLLDGTAALSWSFLLISAIGGVVAATVTVPMQTGVTTLLYIDQRIRREALDLELARAAGLHGYGTPTAERPGG
ncbi:hypothetical protein [Streptomyces sp. W1SF4]|uniref:hypothetical protein n=1 Tax=Streptomyces sp. W1SF4 TaxID=2305220 RepID=UPI000F71C12E|nr:hypothetical protein [Streptomyces sp. W1SF4]AZM89412.1 hypothetical protein D1J60_13765 [Streptomyces sp. W1SF4]